MRQEFLPVFSRGLFLSAVPQDLVLASLSDYSVLLGNLFCSPLLFPLVSTRNTRTPKSQEQTGVLCCLLEAVHFGPTGPFHLHFKFHLVRSGRKFHLSPEVGMEYWEVGCIGALGSHSRCVAKEPCNLRYHIIPRIPLEEWCWCYRVEIFMQTVNPLNHVQTFMFVSIPLFFPPFSLLNPQADFLPWLTPRTPDRLWTRSPSAPGGASLDLSSLDLCCCTDVSTF